MWKKIFFDIIKEEKSASEEEKYMKNKKYWLIGSGSSSCRRMTADLENVQIHDFEKVKDIIRETQREK